MAEYMTTIRKLYLHKFLMSLMFIGGFWVPFFTTVGHISFFQIMLLESIFIVGVFLFEVPTGAIADFFGRKVSVLISTLVYLFALSIYTAYPTFWMFVVGDIFWALASALYSGAADAMVYDSLSAEKRQSESKAVFGRFHSFEGFGHMLAGPIGGILVVASGLRWTLAYTLIPFVIALGVCFFLKEPRHFRKKSQSYLATVGKGVSYFRNHGILKILAFDRISIHVLSYSMFFLYQLLLVQRGVPLAYFGLYYSLFFGIPILFLNSLKRLETLFGGRRRFIFGSGLLSSGLMLLLGVVPSVLFLTIALLVFTGLTWARDSLLLNYMNKHIPTPIRATVMSTYSMIWALVNAVFFLAVGLLAEWSLEWTFIILGSIGLVATFLSSVKEEHLLD